MPISQPERQQGSVLWLLKDNHSASRNLLKEAGEKGIDPQRLVFAERMNLPDYLARYRTADLFLDTLPKRRNHCKRCALGGTSRTDLRGRSICRQDGQQFTARHSLA